MEATLQLAAWGGSTALRIPKQFLTELNISEKSTVTLKINKDNELIVAPVYRHKTLEERFANWNGESYTPDTEDKEWLNMESVGEEI